MKIAHRLAIVSSAIILAAGCASNQERYSRNSETSSSPNDARFTSFETTASTSSGRNSVENGSQSYAPGGGQISGATTPATSVSETDRQLTAQVQQQLQSDPGLAAVAPNIQITAQNGTVTLMGNVPSDREKEKLEATVRGVVGVVSVKNQLQVSLRPTSERSGQSSRIYTEPSSQISDASRLQIQDSKDEQAPSPTSDQPNDTSRVYSKDPK